MAININTVYKTVLLILNKEQRGYMTPQEFNSIATQVQLEIFEKYFDDLNQQLRVAQADFDYADRVANIDEKIEIFKTAGEAVYPVLNPLKYFTLPTTDIYGDTVDFYRLGSVVYTNDYNSQIELERLQRSEFYYIQNSRLTASTKSHPTYLYENQKLFVAPTSITSNISVNYIRKPKDPIWGFTVGNLGQYIYNPTEYNSISAPTGSRSFELHESEQSLVITKILLYAGIVINDPSIIQIAAQQAQSEDINSKS